MRKALAILLGLGAVPAGGCGSAREAPRPTPTPAARAVSFDESAGGRDVVARVDGVPIYADCVATQAAGSTLDDDAARQAALDDCVAFELLAQEARRRGLADGPEVAEAQTREAVRVLVEREFLPTLDAADDIPLSEMQRMWPRLERFYNHPELRAVYYCRAPVSKKLPRGGPDDQAAEAFAHELYRALTARPLATGRDVYLACAAVGGERKLEISKKPTRFRLKGNIDKTFATAAFSLAEVGQVSEPIRTPWGWDVLYLSEVTPPVELGFAEAVPLIRETLFYDVDFDGYRQSRFLAWAGPLGKGLRIAAFPERVPPPTEAEEQALGAAAAPPGPISPTAEGAAGPGAP